MSEQDHPPDADRPLSLREQQREMTRDRITNALAELVETMHPLDVTMATVAERAGVSEPTLYRHFPTKRDLFATLGSRMFRSMVSDVVPTTIDELVDVLPTVYERFAGVEATIRWNIAAPQDQMVRPSAEERYPMLRTALAAALDDLSTEDQDHLLRGVLLLTAPTSMLYWQDYLDISAEEAAATAGWLIRRLATP